MRKILKVGGVLLMATSFLLPFLAFIAPYAYNVTLHVILSESMHPAINLGDVVGLKRDFDLSDLQIGDVIAFRQPDVSDVPITHRIVEIIEDETGLSYKTQGDASERPDAWTVTEEQVIGKVVFRVPKLGYVTKLVKRHYGYGLLVVLPGILLIILETRDLLRAERIPTRRADWLRGTDRTSAYLFLIAGVIVMSVLYVLVDRTMQRIPLSKFEAPEDEEHSQAVFHWAVRNDNPYPIIICLLSEKAPVTFNQAYFRLSSGAHEPVVMWSERPEDAIIVTAELLPVLPQQLLYRIFAWNTELAPLFTLMIPGLPVTMIGFILLGGLSTKPSRRKRARELQRRLGYY